MEFQCESCNAEYDDEFWDPWIRGENTEPLLLMLPVDQGFDVDDPYNQAGNDVGEICNKCTFYGTDGCAPLLDWVYSQENDSDKFGQEKNTIIPCDDYTE